MSFTAIITAGKALLPVLTGFQPFFGTIKEAATAAVSSWPVRCIGVGIAAYLYGAHVTATRLDSSDALQAANHRITELTATIQLQRETAEATSTLVEQLDVEVDAARERIKDYENAPPATACPAGPADLRVRSGARSRPAAGADRAR